MNIKVQCCGIVITALLIIIYKTRRRMPLITSKAFQGCLYITLGALFLDVLSIYGIVYRDILPAFLPEFICKTYIALLVLVAMMAVIYVATGVSFHLPHYKKMILACMSFSGIMIALIYALPIVIHEEVERSLAWTSGPATTVTYFAVFVFITINLIQIHKYKKYLYERQRQTVLAWMYIWITASIIQLLYNELLLVGFAGSLCLMLVFMQFENPELYLDRSTGLFNYNAYTRYGEQLYSNDKDFYALAVTFENTSWQDMNMSRQHIETRKVYNEFLKIPGAYAFKIQESEIMLFFDKKEEANAAWNKVLKEMTPDVVETFSSHPLFYNIVDPKCVNSPRELLELLRYVNQQRNSAIDGYYHIIDDSTAAQIIAENEIAQMIIDALNEDRIVVYYQPIYSIEQKRFTCAEALVRIIDRDGNLVPPNTFIPVAENNGMINELGKCVFEKVCHFFKEKNLEEYGIEYVEVNLSGVQCVNRRLADDFIHIMETIHLKPQHINLEITESASLNGKLKMIDNIDRMTNYGVNFSLDDFGTGASNLNYIVDMPVKIVKFDKEMIQSYFSSRKAKYVMDAAMHMIHGMGLKIVAEGVETEEQYRNMEEIKINFIQGFYFSQPLPEQEFLNFLLQNMNQETLGLN